MKGGACPGCDRRARKAAAAKHPMKAWRSLWLGSYYRSGDFLKAEGVLAPRLHADPKSIAIGTALAQQYFCNWPGAGCQEAVFRLSLHSGPTTSSPYSASLNRTTERIGRKRQITSAAPHCRAK